MKFNCVIGSLLYNDIDKKSGTRNLVLSRIVDKADTICLLDNDDIIKHQSMLANTLLLRGGIRVIFHHPLRNDAISNYNSGITYYLWEKEYYNDAIYICMIGDDITEKKALTNINNINHFDINNLIENINNNIRIKRQSFQENLIDIKEVTVYKKYDDERHIAIRVISDVDTYNYDRVTRLIIELLNNNKVIYKDSIDITIQNVYDTTNYETVINIDMIQYDSVNCIIKAERIA